MIDLTKLARVLFASDFEKQDAVEVIALCEQGMRRREYHKIRQRRCRDTTEVTLENGKGVSPYNPLPQNTNTPPVSPSGYPPHEKKRGVRIDPEWNFGQAEMAAAVAVGLPANEAAFEWENFKDYWLAASGANAAKRNWLATWRRWCRNHLSRYRRPNGGQDGQPSLKSVVDRIGAAAAQSDGNTSGERPTSTLRVISGGKAE